MSLAMPSSSSSKARRTAFADVERGYTAAPFIKTAPRSRMAPDRTARGDVLICTPPPPLPATATSR